VAACTGMVDDSVEGGSNHDSLKVQRCEYTVRRVCSFSIGIGRRVKATL
jgi:hypothetical protein